MTDAAMSAESIRVDELTARQRQYWRGFCAENPALASPYFTLEFAELVARARKDTRVLAISRNGTPVGFLPYHMSRLGIFRPLAGPMGDHHALISNRADIDLAAALKMAKLGVFTFHGALADQLGFAVHSDDMEPSWVVNMSEGFEAYWEDRRKAEPKAMRNIRARERKLTESGLDVVYRVDDRRIEALDALVRTKRQQYAETGATDVFEGRWASGLIYDLMAYRTDELSGVLSTLEIDGELAAAHFGMRSRDVMHYWFPVYDPRFSNYGPGLLLFRALAEDLAEKGVQRIDLGPGDYDFKHRLSNDAFAIASGAVSSVSVSGAAIAAGRRIDRFAQALPLGRVSHWPGKAMRRLDRMMAIRAI